MANGGKSEYGLLIELNATLENLIDATEEVNISLKNRISDAKRLFSYSSEFLIDTVEKQADKQDNVYEETHPELNHIQSLEEDINKILKMAVKVRNSAKAEEDIKSFKGEVGQSSTSSAAENNDNTGDSSLRSSYNQRFFMNRGGKSINIRKDSRKTEVKCDRQQMAKTLNPSIINQQPVKSLKSEGMSTYIPNKRKKAKYLPTQRGKTKSSVVKVSSEKPSQVSSLLGVLNSKKPSLFDAIMKKAENPKYLELLEVIKCYKNFLREHEGEFCEHQSKLKENFLKKCMNMGDSSDDSKIELKSILKKLLPFSGWASGIEKSADLDLLKTIMLEEKYNISEIMSDYQGKKEEIDFKFVSRPDVLQLREHGIWNETALFPIFEDIQGLDYLKYEDAKEQLSFQNDLHEIQEFHFQLTLFQYLHRIIANYFIHNENFENENLEMFSGDKDRKILLIKCLTAIADFSGHLKMPIWASIESRESK